MVIGARLGAIKGQNTLTEIRRRGREAEVPTMLLTATGSNQSLRRRRLATRRRPPPRRLGGAREDYPKGCDWIVNEVKESGFARQRRRRLSTAQ